MSEQHRREPWIPPAARTGLIVAGTALLASAAYLLAPAGMDELSRRMVAIFIVAAVFWATEVIPLYATSLAVIGLQVLLLAEYGGLAGAGDLEFIEFFEPFASSVIILFLGGFLLARAVTRHRIDAAIAGRLLRPVAHRPVLLIFTIMGLTAFFSMWMSNTATTAMMIAIVTPLLIRLPDDARFARAIILAVPLGANIGGLGTPIGTPPNAVAMAALRRAGYDITFVDWMMLAVPLEIALLLIAGGLLIVFYRPDRSLDLSELGTPEPITRRGKVTLAILAMAIVLWLTSHWHGIADAVIALLAAASLTALSILDRHDVDGIDWNILILMWGGLSLGHGMQVTGLVDFVVDLPVFDVGGFMLGAVIVILAVGLSTFMSNTAAANLIIPMAMALSAAQGGRLAVLTALACSLAMALPVSTPPNAIAFSTGRLPAASLLRVGGIITLIAMIALLLGYQIMIPLVLDL